MTELSIAKTHRPSNPLISIVLPVYNEVDVLDRLVNAITESCLDAGCRFEIVFVNDGSRDGSTEKLDDLANADARIKVAHFSRNFGHQPAVQAGVVHASGDAVVLMDSDMQDDPSAISQFVRRWKEGYDVVYAVRTNRKENWFKRSLFYSFYRVLNAIATTPIPMDAGNFSLIDRRVADQVVRMPERDRFFPGLRHWVGFRQIGVPVERLERHDEQPRVSTAQLFALAKTAIFGFSRAPLNLFYGFAILSLLIFAGTFSFTLYHKFITHLAIPGWTSITMMASLFGTLNSLGICVLGEYVIRIYDQVRARPGFVVGRRVNFGLEKTRCDNTRCDNLVTHSSGDEMEIQQVVGDLSREVGVITSLDPIQPTDMPSVQQ